MRKFLFISMIFLSSCASLFDVDSEIVNTPIHDDTRVFYLDTRGELPTDRKISLVRPYEKLAGTNLDQQNLVENGDPVTIVVNKVILPRHLFDVTETDDRDKKTYDIAVVLDVAALAGQNKQSIAVFYQRGVKANTALAFENLLVFSQDTWDNRFPPYFRVRIFSVAQERNERTRELLDQVSGLSGTLSTIAGVPYAEPALQVAIRAAELVTTGDNEMLVDFQFQLFSTAQSSQSGGMPLGMFRKGGMAIVGIPRGQERQFWGGKTFKYDLESEQILEVNGRSGLTPTDVPFLLATVITTETVVPNEVKKRSAEIFEVLRDQEALRYDFEKVSTSLKRLEVSLSALRAREEFATNPTIGTFDNYVDSFASSSVGDGPDELSLSLYNWLLATARSTTGVRLDDASAYVKWIEDCKEELDFDSEERRFKLRDDTKASCKKASSSQNPGNASEEGTLPDQESPPDE